MTASGEQQEQQEQQERKLPRVFTTVVGSIIVLAGMRAASTVLVPLVAGLFLAVLARPLERMLRGVMPRAVGALALLLTMLTVIAGFVAVGAVATAATGAVASELQERRPALERQADRLRASAASRGITLPGGASESSGGASSQAGGESSASSQSSSSPASATGVVGRAVRFTVSGFGGLLLALAICALVLAERDEGRRRIGALGKGSAGQRALAAIDEAAPAFRHYVLAKSLTSALTGTATGLAAWALGIPLAWVWGLIAFLLEYVPSVGSVIAIVPPVLMALADGGPTRGLLAFGVIATVQIIMGNVVDPRIEGKMMSISPTGVLVSVVFWGWLWGPVGALLAVPLTVAIVIACRHIPGSRGVATLVSGDRVDTKT